MKVKLQFNLPEEQAEFDAALEGYRWKSVCEKMRILIMDQQRNQGRYTAVVAIGEVSEKLYTLVDEAGLSFD
jgi:hypothetical protein